MKKRTFKKIVALLVSAVLFTSAVPVSAEEHIVTEDDITKAALEIAFPEGTDLDFEVQECYANPLSRSVGGEKMLVAKEVDDDEVNVTTVLPLRIEGNTLSNPYYQANTGQIKDNYANLTIISSFKYDKMQSLNNGNLYRARSCSVSWRANTSNVRVSRLTCNVEIMGHRYSDGVYDSPYGDSCLVQSNYIGKDPNYISSPAENTTYDFAQTMPSMGYWVKFTDYSGGHGLFTYRAANYVVNGVSGTYDYGKYIVESGM